MKLYFLPLLLAQLPQAPLPPQAPPVRDELVNVQVPLKHAYREASAHAVSAGKPLIVGLRCVAPSSTGEWVSCNVDALEGFTGQGIVISRPGEGWLVYVATLGPNATAAEIRAALAPKAGIPFGQGPSGYYQPFRGGFGAFGACGPGG